MSRIHRTERYLVDSRSIEMSPFPSPLRQKTFSHRFLREAARPLQLVLLAIGVPLMVSSPATITVTHNNNTKRSVLARKIIFCLWSAFLLILNSQSEIYIFIRRAVKLAFEALLRNDPVSGILWTENFTAALIRSTAFVTETSTHYILVLSIRSILTRFCVALEPIDHLLGHPRLTGIRKGSLAALAFILYTLVLNLICSNLWEIYHPNRPFDMMDAVQNSIRIACQVFTLAALLLFVICGEVLVVYHRSITKHLEDYNGPIRPNKEELWRIVSLFRPLIEVRHRLYQDFRFILLANICLSLVTILSSTYYILHHILWQLSSQERHLSRYLVTLWDGGDIIESFTRLWLICHINDRIHSSVTDCIPVLRVIRDRIESIGERHKLTLFLVELAQSSFTQNETKDVSGLYLFSMVPINKRLILQTFRHQKIFSDRFLKEAARPMQLFLLALGVPFTATPPKTFSINDNRKCSYSTRKIFFCLWIVFWLILNTQSGAYMFIHRVVIVAFQVIGANNLTGKVLTETFTLTLIRSTSFVTETSTHFMLVLTIRSTLTRFCLYLEPIDHLLGRPPLTGVRKSSVAALAFIFYTFILNTVFTILWELHHPTRPFVMTDAIENCIRVACQIFTLAALLLFVICGQVLVAYHQSITKQLEDYQHIHHPRTMEHLWFILSQFRPLIEIRRRLYRDFRYILLANVCLSLVTILAAAYFVLHYMTSSQESRISRFLIIFWDGADVLESFTRLWLVCHINDKIHSSATSCVPVLREIRDRVGSTGERHKLTLFMLEIAQSSTQNETKDVGGLYLFSMVPINKRLILQSMSAILTFLVIILQFKQVTNNA